MPPSRPDFCYYEALGIEQTATQQEIVTAYRSLARIHHPDKNPNDENATARFQRIQAAHETLSDPSKRQRYDDVVANPAGPNTSPFSQHANRGYYYEDSDDDDDEYEYDEDPFVHFFGGGGFGFFGGGGGRFRAPSYEEMEARFREAERQEREMRAEQQKYYEAMRKQAVAERAKRDEEAQQARQLKEEKKMREEKMARDTFEKRERDEKTAQEKLWEELHATTEAEKQKSCQHSAFWTKTAFKKKTGCGACRKGKSMTLFKCPHCSLLACQQCLSTNQKMRTRLGLNG